MIRDIAGAGATQGWAGTATSAANIQKQACEDHADAWAVRFTREAGIDPQGGVPLLNAFAKLQQPGWLGFAQQFISDHSISALRIVHVVALINKKQPLSEQHPSDSR